MNDSVKRKIAIQSLSADTAGGASLRNFDHSVPRKLSHGALADAQADAVLFCDRPIARQSCALPGPAQFFREEFRQFPASDFFASHHFPSFENVSLY